MVKKRGEIMKGRYKEGDRRGLEGKGHLLFPFILIPLFFPPFRPKILIPEAYVICSLLILKLL